MRILIASDQDRDPQRIRAVLASHGMECPSGHSVPLELAVDRASRLRPTSWCWSCPRIQPRDWLP